MSETVEPETCERAKEFNRCPAERVLARAIFGKKRAPFCEGCPRKRALTPSNPDGGA